MTNNLSRCLYCQRTSSEVPLLNINYKDKQYSICPQHLPILIHEPGKLKGLIPDADKLQTFDSHQH